LSKGDVTDTFKMVLFILHSGFCSDFGGIQNVTLRYHWLSGAGEGHAYSTILLTIRVFTVVVLLVSFLVIDPPHDRSGPSLRRL